MLIKEQQHKIIQYLLDKKLSLDVAAEVYDHMNEQVEHLMREENLSFEEAFRKTKRKWGSDLNMVYKPFYSLDDITPLMIELSKKQNRYFWGRAIALSLGLTLLTFLLLLLSPPFSLTYFLIAFALIYVGFMLYSLKEMRSIHKIQKKFPNNRISLHYQWLMAPLSTIGLIMAFINISHWKNFNQSLTSLLQGNTNSETTMGMIVISFAVLLFYFTCTCFIMARKKWKKDFGKIYPFLEKLQQS